MSFFTTSPLLTPEFKEELLFGLLSSMKDQDDIFDVKVKVNCPILIISPSESFSLCMYRPFTRVPFVLATS